MKNLCGVFLDECLKVDIDVHLQSASLPKTSFVTESMTKTLPMNDTVCARYDSIGWRPNLSEMFRRENYYMTLLAVTEMHCL